MQLEKVFGSFGLPASDAQIVTLVLVLLAVTVAFWLLVGRKRLHAVLVNIYLSFILTQAIPKDILGANLNYLVVIFLAKFSPFTAPKCTSLINTAFFPSQLSGKFGKVIFTFLTSV